MRQRFTGTSSRDCHPRWYGAAACTSGANAAADGRGTASSLATQPLVSRTCVRPSAGPATVERTGREPEWVRALPVGNGRLGAMIFGGVVHERLQLNEDTLWAGRPYDPVNPDAKAALPEVRRLLADGRIPRSGAAREREGDGETAGADAVSDARRSDAHLSADRRRSSDYRRDLDLATATAHVSYTSRAASRSSARYSRALPTRSSSSGSRPARPGQISFEARMQTPQRATIDATDAGDLVMRGVNGDGRGTTADGRAMTGALALRGSRPRARHRRHAYQLAGRRRRPRRGRGHAAHRRGHELQEFR